MTSRELRKLQPGDRVLWRDGSVMRPAHFRWLGKAGLAFVFPADADWRSLGYGVQVPVADLEIPG